MLGAKGIKKCWVLLDTDRRSAAAACQKCGEGEEKKEDYFHDSSILIEEIDRCNRALVFKKQKRMINMLAKTKQK